MNRFNRIFRSNIAFRQAWVKRQLEALVPGTSILDVGCGGQPYRGYCDHLIYKAHDFAQLDASTQIIEGKYGPLDYTSDISRIPAADGSFGAILCTEVLEHVPDPCGAITEMARLLQPGGRLILTAPLGSFLHQQPFHYYGGFTPYWYQQFLTQAGFEDIQIEANGGFFRFFGQECQRVTRLLFRRRPWTSPLRWLLFPMELLSLLFFTLFAPFLCSCLDGTFDSKDCTIGYHVTATKTPSTPISCKEI